MKKVVKIIIIVVIAFGIIGYFADGGGLDTQVENEMQKINNQVANDAVKQYEIAKRNGSAMDAYVQAGMVSASYLQAKDEVNYKKWKAIEAQEAKLAGF